MSITRIDEDLILPYDEEVLRSGNPARIAKYMLDLVQTLNDFLKQVAEIVNLTIDQADGDAIYSKLKLADGTYPLGTWRFIQVEDNLERQVQLTLGAWTKAGVFNRPKT